MTELAQTCMTRAGLHVIDAIPYEKEYAENKTQLYVSRWEGHPNEVANALFAKEFVSGILKDPRITKKLRAYAIPNQDAR